MMRLLLAGQPVGAVALDVRHYLTQPGEAASTHIDHLMDIFCEVARAGGFWSGGESAERVQVERLLPASFIDKCLVLQVHTSALDIRMWQCWRLMVGRAARVNLTANAIELRPHGRLFAAVREIDIIDEFNEVSSYPAASPEVRDVLHWEDSNASKSRRCLLELDRPVLPHEVDLFEAWVQPWYAMLESAAFSLPIGPPHEEECLRGVVSQFDENTLELTVDRFRASEQAWMVLGNMAATWGRHRAGLRQYVVD